MNGKVNFYYDGVRQGSTKSGTMVKLTPGGKFSIGVEKDLNSGIYTGSFFGYLSCVNIWSYIQSTVSILAMSSGGMNINGDLLAWRDVQGYIVGNLSILPNTTIYFPGKILFLLNIIRKNSAFTTNFKLVKLCGNTT